MTIHRSLTGTTFLTFAFCAAASGQSANWPQAKLVSRSETLLQQAPVSAGYIRGLQMMNGPTGEAEKKVDLVRLFVHLTPRQAAARAPVDLCVEVSRRDGSYLASNQYQLPLTDVPSYGEIDIVGSSQHPEFYRGVSARSLAVVAHTGACARDDEPLVPVFWNSPPIEAAPRTLVIAVQSGDRDATLYWGGKGGSRTGWLCHSITEPGVARFDSLCEQQVSEVPSRGDTIVDLEACSFGECGIVQHARVQQ